MRPDALTTQDPQNIMYALAYIPGRSVKIAAFAFAVPLTNIIWLHWQGSLHTTTQRPVSPSLPANEVEYVFLCTVSGQGKVTATGRLLAILLALFRCQY